MPEKPELVAKPSVGSAISGECSVCHEVIVVQGAVTAELRELNQMLKQAFEKHVGSKHSLEDSEHGITIGETSPLAGVALVSFAALLMELALTRIFSVVFFYHYAFLAISSALLGLGTGGVFAHLRQQQLARHSTRQICSLLSAISGIAVVVALEVTLHVQVAMQLSAHNLARLSAAYLASAMPFFLTGLLLSMVFAREVQRIPLLYGADLLGGALACLAVVPLLNWIGGPNTVLFAGMLMALASAVWASTKRCRMPGLCPVSRSLLY
jgi:hypothetical protein